MTNTPSIKSTEIAGYLVRSTTNARNILCVDGEFYDESLVGVGRRAGRVFKTERNALRVRGGAVTAHPVNAHGIEISWICKTFPEA
jgi:hypothetical protein